MARDLHPVAFVPPGIAVESVKRPLLNPASLRDMYGYIQVMVINAMITNLPHSTEMFYAPSSLLGSNNKRFWLSKISS